MKLHRHLVLALAESLHHIFVEGFYADKVIERQLKFNKRWGSRDRKFFAESLYDLVRWWRTLWAMAGLDYPKIKEPISKDALLKIIAIYLLDKYGEVPDWDIFSNVKIVRPKKDLKSLGERYAFSDWLVEVLCSSFPEERWAALFDSLNEPASVHLRVNTLKTTRESLKAQLEREGLIVKDSKHSDVGLELAERKNVFLSPLFKQGLFEVQDEASQSVAPLVGALPGEFVIDACAGAGGKSLHLAALMKNKGRIFAFDIYEKKLDELRRRAARAGADNIQVRPIESAKTLKKYSGQADRLLLDVPCTGLGVLRRNPDTKWKISATELEQILILQREILSSYSTVVKAGGVMVYATCSLLPVENINQVEWFLAHHAGWKLETTLALYPDTDGTDGFFAAKLLKSS